MPKKKTLKQKERELVQLSVEEALEKAENAHQDFQPEDAGNFNDLFFVWKIKICSFVIN
jgi:hypothetical protein